MDPEAAHATDDEDDDDSVVSAAAFRRSVGRLDPPESSSSFIVAAETDNAPAIVVGAVHSVRFSVVSIHAHEDDENENADDDDNNNNNSMTSPTTDVHETSSPQPPRRHNAVQCISVDDYENARGERQLERRQRQRQHDIATMASLPSLKADPVVRHQHRRVIVRNNSSDDIPPPVAAPTHHVFVEDDGDYWLDHSVNARLDRLVERARMRVSTSNSSGMSSSSVAPAPSGDTVVSNITAAVVSTDGLHKNTERPMRVNLAAKKGTNLANTSKRQLYEAENSILVTRDRHRRSGLRGFFQRLGGKKKTADFVYEM